jgi:hypothetical protein
MAVSCSEQSHLSSKDLTKFTVLTTHRSELGRNRDEGIKRGRKDVEDRKQRIFPSF